MRNSAPLIRVRDLSLTHAGASDPSPASITFDVRPGEVILVLGPSGSGKSTLTLALNGLIPHSLPARIEGGVEIAGRDTAEASVAELSTQVSMVFQDPDSQLVTGTVLDEVAFALENLRMPVDEVLARSEAALRRLGLWERRTWNPDRLSGGGRQRLAIACAVASGAPIVVLDEPTANLDPQGIDDVYEALRDLAADGEHTIVLVEHNLDAAMSFATRVIVLDRDGRLAFDGPTGIIIREHTDALVEMGVWLPAATLAARQLRLAGVSIKPLPLTSKELRESLPAVLPVLVERAESAPVTSPALITVRDLNVTKHRQRVLHDVNLEIAEGSLTAIVGANGAGKTTLLQAIAGVVPPPRRRIQVGALDPATASPRELAAEIGFVFQNPEHQFITTTVFDELAHGLRLRRLDDIDVHAQVTEMLLRFGLEKKAAVHPFLLSGGEKRRLSVGTALITRPRVLALDEPTFGQDRARAAELLHLLHALRDEGTTILLVTHDLQLVADHTTHTIVLSDGRVHAAGPTTRLLGDASSLEGAGLRLPVAYRALPPALWPLLRDSHLSPRASA